MDAVVIGGSRGIGRAISDALRSLECKVVSTSKSQCDTSNLASVRKFAGDNAETDILVLNTGGPPPKEFDSITQEDWERYHNQLFLGFCILLREIKVRDGGYVFLISSSVIREPSPKLVMSGAYRSAFSSVFKVLSKKFAERDISCINIAPGPTNTDRMRELVKDVKKFESGLPMKRLGEPAEIGNFVSCIVQHRIKYLSGVVNFDGAGSDCV